MHLWFQVTQVSSHMQLFYGSKEVLIYIYIYVGGSEGSSGDKVSTCTSILPKPDSSSSDYTYVDITTNERYATATEH